MNPGFAPAKVNLWLHVGRRRRDSYHELSSLIVFAADAGDELTARPSDALELETSGPGAGALSGDDNLVMTAARRLAEKAHKHKAGARLHLHKVLPVAAGLGGGSADAAAALRLLNREWGLDWPMSRLTDLAKSIGADVPVCLWSRPAAVEGIGERVELLSVWPELDAVLVNPGVALSTAEVFARFDAEGRGAPKRIPPPLGLAHRSDAIALVRKGANDLEPAARSLVPAIGEALSALESGDGCAVARMTGSGASCFGLYENAAYAARAAARISKANPGWWVRAVRLAGYESG